MQVPETIACEDIDAQLSVAGWHLASPGSSVGPQPTQSSAAGRIPPPAGRAPCPTEYHDSRTKKKPCPDRETAFRQAVEGWRFEPHQNKQLMKTKKFRTWYHTTFDRREFQLPEHFGCGSNKDPRHTIRIAFNWDEKTKKVVLGYLGQHQQTSAT